MSRTRSGLLLSLSDVAALAKVRRPVVSVWRGRSKDSDLPFPGPVASAQGQDRFELDDIVDWLEATGRGNNPEVRADAAAFALPASPAGDEARFRVLTGLLCLKVVSGEPLSGLTSTELVDLADEWDPDDELLLAEVEQAGQALPELAAFADRLADAAYSPAGAFERLMSQRFRLRLTGHVTSQLADAATTLVIESALALAGETDAQLGPYVDPTPGGSDLLVALGQRAEAESATFQVPAGDDPAARLVRRRLWVHGLQTEPVATDAGAFQLTGPAVVLAAFPASAGPDPEPAAVLTAIDDIQLQMSDQQRAVVLAPASVLTDRITDRQVEQLRDRILRLGRVRAILRLPTGLVPARPQQALALWILGPDYAHVRAEDRWTSVADLGDVQLEPASIDDLVSDLVAAMGDEKDVRAHAFRFLRLAPTRSLLAGRHSLVPARAALARQSTTPAAELSLRLAGLRSALDRPVGGDPLDGVELTTGAGRRGERLTLAEWLARGRLSLIAGNRVTPEDLGTVGVPVLGVPELTGEQPVGRRRIDRLLLAERYDAARLTEPGDVVFTSTGRPAALIDETGGSVAVYPARVLRLSDRGDADTALSAPVVAHDINAQPPHARSWRRWSVRSVPAAQAAVLADLLDRARTARDEAVSRAEQLATMGTLLTEGITSGAFTVEARDGPPTSETQQTTLDRQPRKD